MDIEFLLNKMKIKAEDNDKNVQNTCDHQTDFIGEISNFNGEIKSYIEMDVITKNSFKEGQEKLLEMKRRLEHCKVNVLVIKDRIEKINTTLANKI